MNPRANPSRSGFKSFCNSRILCVFFGVTIGKKQPGVHLFKQVPQKSTAGIRRFSTSFPVRINLNRCRNKPAARESVGLRPSERTHKKTKPATAPHYAASLRTIRA